MLTLSITALDPRLDRRMIGLLRKLRRASGDWIEIDIGTSRLRGDPIRRAADEKGRGVVLSSDKQGHWLRQEV